jgi:hypothetical protein
MNTLVFRGHLNKKNTLNSLQAFELVRGLSESELETLEILSDAKNKKILEQSINESKKNKIEPIESIL